MDIMDDLQTPETAIVSDEPITAETPAEPVYRYGYGERVTFGEGTQAVIVGTWALYGVPGYRMRTNEGVEVDVSDAEITGRAE